MDIVDRLITRRDPATDRVETKARCLLASLWNGADEVTARSVKLRRHGLELRRMLLAEPGAVTVLTGRLSIDDPPRDLLAVRRLALGWAGDERAGATEVSDDEPFAATLDALLAGLAPDDGPNARRLQQRLWALLSVARESADIVYSRAAGLPELDRRILLLLYGDDARVAKDVTRLMGVDKAQVSRSVKRLIESGFVERATVRRPLALTEAGRGLTARLRRMFEVRSREVALGIDADALAAFFEVLDEVDANAIALFEEERDLATSSDRREASGAGILVSEAQPRQPETIVTRFITVFTYIQRSGALAYKRLTGLSNFEARVLMEIARQPPIDWGQLTTALARDESQAARTVRRLVERGLVERQGIPGRREGSLRPTPEGERVYAILEAEGRRRDALLVQGISPDMLKAFLTALERMTWNVQAQLIRDLAAQASDAMKAG